MKTNFLLLLLCIPVIFIAASMPITNTSNLTEDENFATCSSWGEVHMNWDGNSGCGYPYNFSTFVNGSCVLEDIDLNLSASGIQNTFEDQKVYLWTNGYDGIIHMLPKPGYTGPGFIQTCDVNLYFEGSAVEYAKWTCIVDAYAGPYPPKCY